MNNRTTRSREAIARQVLDRMVSVYEVTPGGDKLYNYEDVIHAMLWFEEELARKKIRQQRYLDLVGSTIEFEIPGKV